MSFRAIIAAGCMLLGASAIAPSALAVGHPARRHFAKRYAAPNGTKSGSCKSSAHPCDLVHAVAVVQPGDDLTVDPGNYIPGVSYQLPPGSVKNVPGPLQLFTPITMHGKPGAARPTIICPAAQNFACDLAPGGGTLQGIDFVGSGYDQSVLGLDFTIVQDIDVSAGPADLVGGLPGQSNPVWVSTGVYLSGGTIRDSTVRITAPDSTALQGSGTVRNSTIWATGAGDVGMGVSSESDDEFQSFRLTAVDDIIHGDSGPTGTGVDVEATADGKGNAKVTLSRCDYATIDAIHPSTGAATITAPGTAGNRSAPPLLVNPAGGDLRELAGSPTINGGVNSPANGLTDFDGNLRLVGARTDIGAYEFVPLPVVKALPATAIGPHRATLRGLVTPKGGLTSAWFLYGTTKALGTMTVVRTQGNGLTPKALTAKLTGLAHHTRYYFEVVAADDRGTVTTTPPKAFKTG